MPSSRYAHIPAVIGEVMRIDPLRVLDVGCGAGKWGVLFREYLELWNGGTRQIDAVEVFEPYIKPYHRAVYDNVYVGDVREVIDSLGFYDLIFMGDVIEHFDATDVPCVLRQMLYHASVVLLSTPTYMCEQGAVCGNEHERHLCLVDAAMLSGAGFRIEHIADADGIAVYTVRG